jgi:hypothetical protein
MGTIEIRVGSLAQLYDALDPSPFRDRGLDPGADRYIIECAGDFPANEDLRLQIQVPDSMRGHERDAEEAVRRHFSASLRQVERRHRRRMRSGRVSLLAGSAVLVLTTLLRATLGDWLATPVGQGVGEGLLILGWVVLWRPAEVLLFERWEFRQERQLLARLAKVPVEFAPVAADR